jgi:hypothetical protein
VNSIGELSDVYIQTEKTHGFVDKVQTTVDFRSFKWYGFVDFRSFKWYGFVDKVQTTVDFRSFKWYGFELSKFIGPLVQKRKLLK